MSTSTKKKSRKISQKSDINVTPFIDILLVLLVIFMTITPLTPKGLDAAVPQPPPPGAPPPPPSDRTIIISIDKENNVKINSDPVDISQLGARLQEIFASRNERIAFVSGNPELFFNDVVQVIDIAKGAGVDKIGLMTEQVGASQ